MRTIATLICVCLSLAAGTALSGEASGLSPEVYREISGKIEAMKANPRQAKEMSAELVKLVDKHRAALLAALKGGAALERTLAAGVLHLSSGDKPEVGAVLAAALKDEDLQVRRGAAAGLARLQEPSTVGALTGALEDVDEAVRAAAAGALGPMKAVGATEALVKALGDENWQVRLAACRSLDALATKENGEQLAVQMKPLLEDENAYVRMAAAAVVKKLAGLASGQQQGKQGGQKDENVLHELAKEMRDVKDELDAEHHGSEVRVAEEGIAQKLDEIIKMVEEQQQQQQQQQGQGQGQGQQQQQQQGQQQGAKPGNQSGQKPGQQGGQNPSSPMQGEFMTSGGVQHGQKAELGAIGADWGKLPEKEREKMLQAAGADLPENYRKMVEVFLMGIAEEKRR